MLQIYGVSRMLVQSSEMSSARKTWKKVHIKTCRQTVFEVQTPRSADLNPFLGDLKTLVCSAAFQNEEALHQRNFYAFKPFATAHETFESVRQSMIRSVHACTDCFIWRKF
jgi:hypothetical protein